MIFINGTQEIIKFGLGTQVWPNGSKYVGNWRNNKANGKGEFIHYNNDTYQGDFEDDRANG